MGGSFTQVAAPPTKEVPMFLLVPDGRVVIETDEKAGEKKRDVTKGALVATQEEGGLKGGTRAGRENVPHTDSIAMTGSLLRPRAEWWGPGRVSKTAVNLGLERTVRLGGVS